MYDYCFGGLFKSEDSWIHPDALINTNEIIFVTKGTVFIEEDGAEYTLRENDVLYLEKGKPHGGFKESSGVEFYWIHFKNKCDFKFKTVDGKRLAILCRQLLHYEYTPSYPKAAAEYAFRLIKIEIAAAPDDIKSGKLCGTVKEWIRLNSDGAIDVKSVSEHFNYNSDYLCRIFKANYGTSLKEYICRCRCEYIKTVLATTDLSLEEISERTGFESYGAFLKFFKYHEGISPTKYKNAYFNLYMNKK